LSASGLRKHEGKRGWKREGEGGRERGWKRERERERVVEERNSGEERTRERECV
jgi:hypothetical protein